MPLGCLDSLAAISRMHSHDGAGTQFSSISRAAADHIIRRQRPPDPLQLELTDRLDAHGVLDLHQHSRADEDLPRLGFIAQPRGDVGYRADSGIIEASLEADGAERGEAVRNADAEANLVAPATPRLVNAPMASRISSAMSTA